MGMDRHVDLSRRERLIIDIVYERGEPSVNEVQELLPDPPSHTASRMLLKILEGEGRVKRRKDGRQFRYGPKQAKKRSGLSAMQRVVHTFFDGSTEKATGAHPADPRARPSPAELEHIENSSGEARRRGD